MGLCENKDISLQKLHLIQYIEQSDIDGIVALDIPDFQINIKNSHYLQENTYIYYDCVNEKAFWTKDPKDNSKTKDMVKLQISFKNTGIYFSQKVTKFPTSQNVFWLRIFRSFCRKVNNFYEEVDLIEGMLIRIGKVVLRVHQISHSHSREESGISQNVSHTIDHKKDKKICRICYRNETSQNKFVRKICSCNHTHPIHFQCLQKWIFESQLDEGIDVQKTDLRRLKCELCSNNYNQFVKVGKNLHNLTHYKYQLSQPFIIFDVLYDNGVPQVRFIIKKQTRDNFNIGQSSESHIGIRNATIDEKHAQIFYDQQKWKIRDLDSTYGTYALMNQEINLNRPQEIQLSAHNMLLNIHSYVGNKCKCKRNFTQNSTSLKEIEDSKVLQRNQIDYHSAKILPDLDTSYQSCLSNAPSVKSQKLSQNKKNFYSSDLFEIEEKNESKRNSLFSTEVTRPEIDELRNFENNQKENQQKKLNNITQLNSSVEVFEFQLIS